MRPRPFQRSRDLVLILAAAAAVGGCGSDAAMAPVVPVTRSITVDASTGYVYLALDTVASVVNVADPSTSVAWDMGFFATGVKLNGGAAGPGNVSGYCLCQNAAATGAQLQAMTPVNQLAAFDSVTAGMSPAATAFVSDAIDPVINNWATTTGAAAAVAPGKAWILRRGTGTAILGKFQVTAIVGPSASGPGQVVFQYAIEPSAGAAFGSVQTDTVTVAAGAWTYFNLATNAVSTSAAWDIAFDGWNIRVNGGVSGPGGMLAVLDNSTAFALIDYPYAATAPPQAYRGDTFSGVFGANAWYRYNITGTDNQIWPVFNVYLVRRGTALFKVELTGYYSVSAVPRNITIRYAKLAG